MPRASAEDTASVEETAFAAFARELTERAACGAADGSIPAPWACNLAVMRRVASTNDLGRRILDEYADEDRDAPEAVLVAWEQQAGRGRQGNAWTSAPGRGVWLSVVRPVTRAAELPTLPLLVPVAVAKAVNRAAGGERCRIKWPNDLLVDERKVAGVLISGITGRRGLDGRSAAEGGPGGGVVIGVGVNHGQGEDELAELSPRGARGATSLRQLADEPPSLADLAWEVIRALAEELRHAGDGPEAVRRYQELSLHRVGERLRCIAAGEPMEGTFLGFDRRGFLRLELATSGAGRRSGEEVLVTAGEVVSP